MCADIGGLDSIVASLRESIIYPLLYPTLFTTSSSLLGAPKGVLLYGPPGCGKTMLAKALAKESGATFINIAVSSLANKWYGESNKLVAGLFGLARKCQPSIIFIDEIDALAPARSGMAGGEPHATERVVNTLLAEMDGIEEMASVIVIGATNRPNLVDPALLRPGRLDELVYVPVPDESGRLKILQIHARKMPLAEDVDLADLAARTPRYTGADLEDLVRRAGMMALRRDIDSKQVTAEDFDKALTETRASVSPEMEREYDTMHGKIRENALSLNPIGFVVPGQLKPFHDEKHGAPIPEGGVSEPSQ